ncbi:LysR family transcriptional regulator [Ensifer sp. ENS05]|uniref:LysR family transcriptional regulator n=1 Tax=Ensifer sp. ENS05 TaxID=2769277 RepID=UPI0017872E2B|nr:LysR family transcriptional regulator [Ensifer sp. ENS05]MBD9596401.1 LysR family transcriptional regulator [Ensifer sp. ENS05]
MASIKQIEAFFWSGQLGSFVAAAERLDTTQSNISKRIQELEMSLGIELFDRGKRMIRLTTKGEEAMDVSEKLLQIHMRLQQKGQSVMPLGGRFRFGVTEAVAVTWLPRFSALLKESFEGLVPIATVETTANLNQLVMQRKIDLAIGTSKNLDQDLQRVPLGTVERVWVASPSLVPHDGTLSIAELCALPMLAHSDDTAARALVPRHLQAAGIVPNIVSSCTSINALARMAVAGIGITYLHKEVFEKEIALGRLKVVHTELKVPTFQYVAAYRDDVMNPVAALAAQKAKEVCRFTRANAEDASTQPDQNEKSQGAA